MTFTFYFLANVCYKRTNKRLRHGSIYNLCHDAETSTLSLGSYRNLKYHCPSSSSSEVIHCQIL